MRAPPIVLVLLVVTAGCLGSDEATEDDDAGEPPDDELAQAAPEQIPAPGNWSVGRFWTYESTGSGATTYVVTGDVGSSWMVETSSPSLAFIEADDDLSWLGPIRKGDLAGSEPEGPVEYFQFPLEQGKSWTVIWDGAPMTITVTELADGVATLEAVRDGDVWARYTYDQSIEWFGDRAFFFGGQEVFSIVYQRDGEGFRGDIARWTLQTVVEQQGPVGAQPETWNTQFEVPEGITDVWLGLQALCPSGVLVLDLVAVDAQETYRAEHQCPIEVQTQQVLVEAPVEGRWEGGFLTESPQGEGSYEVRILLRTLELVRFG